MRVMEVVRCEPGHGAGRLTWMRKAICVLAVNLSPVIVAKLAPAVTA